MRDTTSLTADFSFKKNTNVAIEFNDIATRRFIIETLGAVRLSAGFSHHPAAINTTGKTLPPKNDIIRQSISDLPSTIKSVSVVLNDRGGFNCVQRVPLGTEDQIRTSVREALHRTGKIDLTRYRWTITPLTDGAVQTHGMTEALTVTTCVLVSGIRKEIAESLCEAIRSQGVQIDDLLMPWACLVKSFRFFAGPLVDGAILGLLHQTAGRSEIFILRDGALAMYREIVTEPSTTAATSCCLEEVKTYLKQVEAKLKLPLKCVFVSGDNIDPEIIAEQLKKSGRYARTWNAAKKIPAAEHVPVARSADLNIALGAALIAADNAANSRVISEEDTAVAHRRIARKLIVPLSLSACALLIVLCCLTFHKTSLSRRLAVVNKQITEHQKQGVGNKLALQHVNQTLDQLEQFADARTQWSGIVSGLRHVDIAGVDLLQMRGTEVLSTIEPNRFSENASTQLRRKNSGQFVLEARNSGGLDSLEEFLNTIQINPLVSPFLNKRKPSRLLNNLQASDSPTVSIFTVEYLLNEKIF